MTAPGPPAAGDEQASNRQRAERLWWNAQSQLPTSGIEAVRDALDAAEARGRAEIAAKVEALAASLELNADQCPVGERSRIYRYAAKRARKIAKTDAS